MIRRGGRNAGRATTLNSEEVEAPTRPASGRSSRPAWLGPPRRRRPVDWRRYSKQARRARRKLPRYEHPLLVSLAISIVFTFAGIALLQLMGVGVAAGLRDLTAAIAGALPQAQEEPLVIGETQVNVSAAPILEGLPEFSKTNEVSLAGRVPDFAVRPERAISLAVNGQFTSTFAIGPDGKFGGSLVTLADGSNTLVVTLLDGQTEIDSSSYTVVVDHTPPVLSLTRPKDGDEVVGPDVVIEGRTEPAADVAVNDRALRPNPDGSFTERLVAQPGPLKVTIVAKDKAGNETKAQLTLTVKAPSQSAVPGVSLAVSLDRTRVRQGETVVARILATQDGRPKAGLAVTLQVGVITIGSYSTDANGIATVGFAAPDHDIEDVAVVALGGGASARATFSVGPPPTPTPTARP